MSALDLEALLAAAGAAASAGGEIVAAHFGAAPNTREKAPGDWVSDADIGSEHAVRAALARAAPEIPFFGEEEGGAGTRQLGWFVDPLDGTANFVHGFPMVGVSVALVEENEPVVGVVHAPILGDVYTAIRGRGARRNGTPIRVSERTPEHAICATGFPFRKPERRPRYLPVFEAALAEFEDLRRAGAASLDLAWTAAGVFDGYFELGLGTWDVAAGGLLVREAGGTVTDWGGDSHAWLSTGNVVVGSPSVHARLLALTADP